jgi:hypothetical protein
LKSPIQQTSAPPAIDAVSLDASAIAFARADDRGPTTDDRRPMTDDRRPPTADRRPPTADRRPIADTSDATSAA